MTVLGTRATSDADGEEEEEDEEVKEEEEDDSFCWLSKWSTRFFQVVDL